MQKKITKGDESNQEKFCKSGFIDVMICRFIDLLKAISDKSPIS